MGKLSKKTKDANGQNVLDEIPDKAGGLGLSEKSKKIKKKKKRVPDFPEIGLDPIIAGEVTSKKSKKKKRKQESEEQTGNSSEIKPHNDPEETAPKLSKKNKKKKHRNPDIEAPTDPESTKFKKKKSKKSGAENPIEDTEQEVTARPKKTKKTKASSGEKTSETKKPKIIEADQDVITSESESEAEDQADVSKQMDAANQSILSEIGNQDGNTKTEKPATERKSTRIQGPEYSVFVGNLPTTVKKATMKALFKQYGEILTVRFRTSDGVSLFKKKDRREAKALICYVRFATKEASQAACAMNGQTVEQNRIRVLLQNQKHMGHAASTVFVGNIHRNTTDNELYDFFSRVGEIEYVRQISDKGIGYVCFKKGIPIAKALKLNQQLLNGRPLRISKCDSKLQNQRRNKKGNLVNKHRPPTKAPPAGQTGAKTANGTPKPRASDADFHGEVAKKKAEKRQKRHKKGKGEYNKKILAKKLIAAGGARKQR